MCCAHWRPLCWLRDSAIPQGSQLPGYWSTEYISLRNVSNYTGSERLTLFDLLTRCVSINGTAPPAGALIERILAQSWQWAQVTQRVIWSAWMRSDMASLDFIRFFSSSPKNEKELLSIATAPHISHSSGEIPDPSSSSCSGERGGAWGQRLKVAQDFGMYATLKLTGTR